LTERGLSRRDFGLLAAAASLAPALAPSPANADSPQPVIMAEGGAAEERIEDTASALALAIDQGCDFLQVNLFPTSDGVLVARRDNELSATTDIAARPEFAARRTTKTVDGQAAVQGWFAEDFTLAELKTLFCRERLSAMRPQNLKYNGKEPILTLAEVLKLARDGCVRTARTVGVCPRLVRVGYFAGLGLAADERLAQELATEGYVAPAAAIWVQALEPEVLKGFAKLSPVRRMQLIDTDQAAAMTTGAALATIRNYADAIAPDQDLVIDPNAAVFPAPTTLTLDAHSAGLQVFSRTARIENAFLPPALRRGDKRSPAFPAGHGDVDKLLLALFANGVDGLATDLPERAAHARSDAIAALQQRNTPNR
jgi:glycerophosphoryl diester phosphodiesterase